MVGGQMLDLVGEKTVFNLDEITRLQMLKTGALFRFSCQVGAILGNASAEDRKTLQMYADSIGLCFQIIDDLLDIEGSEAEVGKSVGRDVDAHKATFVSLLGIEQARVKASQLAEKAVVQLERYGAEADPLREVAIFIVKRHS
jgi:farnesyl diphosphate synthase